MAASRSTALKQRKKVAIQSEFLYGIYSSLLNLLIKQAITCPDSG